MSSRGKNCYGSLLRGSVVQGWERSTLRITEGDTARTERILMRLVDTSSLDSRLHHSGKRVFARHPCIGPVLSCCLCQCSSFLLSPRFAQIANQCFHSDHAKCIALGCIRFYRPHAIGVSFCLLRRSFSDSACVTWYCGLRRT